MLTQALKPQMIVEVNGARVSVAVGSTVIQACEAAGVEIPRFCYHERLLVAGNCRACLVEVVGSPKPQASCALPVMPNMKVFTDSPRVKKARERVREFLLLTHPLDCPICDQGGECDRQDEAMAFGSDRGRGQGRWGSGVEAKRGVEDKDWGPRIKAIMTRCIHCTRCVRFSSEIAGVSDRGTSGRGVNTEIGTYVSKPRASERSGNVIDLCPVGALTAKSYAFQARPWELKSVDAVDIVDGMGSSVRVQSRDQRILRVMPRVNDGINQAWLGDASRFSVDGFTRDRLTSILVRGESTTASSRVSRDRLTLARRQGQEEGRPRDVVLSPHLPVEVGLGLTRWLNDRGFLASSQGSTTSKTSKAKATRWSRGGLSQDENTSMGVDAHERRFRIRAVSEADVVRLVGMNPRVESPLLHARLRESFLRDRVTVMSRGPDLDLTFPVTHRGHDRGVLTSRVQGRHARSSVFSMAQRPRIVVGPSFYERSDASEGLSLRRTFGRRRESLGRTTESSWNVLNVFHPHAGSMGLHVRSRPRYRALTPGSTTVLVGVEEADLIRHGVTGYDASESRGLRVTFSTHRDRRARSADLSIPRPRGYEMESTWRNTEGVSQSVDSVLPSSVESILGASWSSLARDGGELPAWRDASVSSWANGEASLSMGVASHGAMMAAPMTPRAYDYYLESHPVRRRSRRMARASMSFTHARPRSWGASS